MADEMYCLPADSDVVNRVVQLAEHKGASPAPIATAWLLHQPSETAPIVGVRRARNLEEMVAAPGIALMADERAFLETLYQPLPFRGHDQRCDFDP